ncbi:uncharacterized protein LOC129599623 [Paramacrobiotus metropolitanus]|uniref:uncharacterized protein LOC129599623 n=1 Tax=Paramacrobiotus metropolitanus TaxID=2943436 RepID=UPI0024457C87|nr:uncharacterized protein LOC129599623 [Paramacrobiotus metropolitanus]
MASGCVWFPVTNEPTYNRRLAGFIALSQLTLGLAILVVMVATAGINEDYGTPEGGEIVDAFAVLTVWTLLMGIVGIVGYGKSCYVQMAHSRLDAGQSERWKKYFRGWTWLLIITLFISIGSVIHSGMATEGSAPGYGPLAGPAGMGCGLLVAITEVVVLITELVVAGDGSAAFANQEHEAPVQPGVTPDGYRVPAAAPEHGTTAFTPINRLPQLTYPPATLPYPREAASFTACMVYEPRNMLTTVTEKNNSDLPPTYEEVIKK